jgi:dihydropteroate synthase
MHWQTTRFRLDLTVPNIMGIVNVTPDSFSDGGQHAAIDAALAHCEQLISEGATILDIGAESTRPGAQAVPLELELERLIPVLKLATQLNVPISVDTYKPQVMQVALDLGVDIINDIWALRQGEAQRVIASHPTCGVCIMHMHGEPHTMQIKPMSGVASSVVYDFLQARSSTLQQLGIQSSRICLDPGFGFGKSVDQNFELLANQANLSQLNHPILVGWSRKSSLGAVTGCDVQDRLIPSVAAALLAIERGAHIVRVHDVAATRQALLVREAMRRAQTA